MIIEVLDLAENDLLDGYEFYDRQSKGLGSYFLESLFSDIESLQLYAGIHAQYFGYHRLLSRRFPFAIYYKFDKETVKVYAILDCRQNPAGIRKRIS